MAQNVNIQVVEIPYSHKSKQSYAMMRAFISDFIDELQNTYIARGSKKKETWKITALQMKYLWDGPKDSKVCSDKEIGASVGLSSERVRTVMLEMAAEAMRMLETGGDYENLGASADMRDMFRRFRQDLRSIELFDLLARRYAVHAEDQKTLMFFLDGLNYKRSKSKYYKEYCIDTNVFDDNAITILNGKVGNVIKFFKEDPRPLRLETEVRPFMKSKKGWSDEECRQLEAYLKADTMEYEWLGQDSHGRQLVALNWESLDAVDSRMARILFEYGEMHEDDPYMNNDKLIEEYDRRALALGIEQFPEGHSIPKHPHIESIGNGRFRYIGDASASQGPVDLPAEIKKFVGANNGIVLVDDALAFARSLNPKYSLSTVKRYLDEADCIFDTWNKTNYAVHDDPVARNQYYLMTGKVIKRKITPPRQKPLSPATITLRAKAVDFLLQAPNQTMAKKDLAAALAPFYTGKSISTNLPKILSGDLFISIGKGKGSSYQLNMTEYNKQNGQ